MNATAVEMVNVDRTFADGEGGRVTALQNVCLNIAQGDWLSVTGPSGSGKSTLLNIIGCIDRPTSGRYLLNGHDVASLDDSSASRVRNRTIGFIFQSFYLLPRLSVLENVLVPVRFSRIPYEEAAARANELLRRVGLQMHAHRRPSQLSGGETQRAAIARAMIMRPTLLLADEPTGNLDSANAAAVLCLLQELNQDGQSLVVVTHDEGIANKAPRKIVMKDGAIYERGN